MKKFVKTIVIPFISFVCISCASVPEIPADASSTQLIQLGQDALSVSNYKAAETYYKAVIQRYGMDTATYIEASYELGHMYLKQKKYESAYIRFKEILDIFQNAEPGSIPSAYKKLASMGMNRIPEKYLPQQEATPINN